MLLDTLIPIPTVQRVSFFTYYAHHGLAAYISFSLLKRVKQSAMSVISLPKSALLCLEIALVKKISFMPQNAELNSTKYGLKTALLGAIVSFTIFTVYLLGNSSLHGKHSLKLSFQDAQVLAIFGCMTIIMAECLAEMVNLLLSLTFESDLQALEKPIAKTIIANFNYVQTKKCNPSMPTLYLQDVMAWIHLFLYRVCNQSNPERFLICMQALGRPSIQDHFVQWYTYKEDTHQTAQKEQSPSAQKEQNRVHKVLMQACQSAKWLTDCIRQKPSPQEKKRLLKFNENFFNVIAKQIDETPIDIHYLKYIIYKLSGHFNIKCDGYSYYKKTIEKPIEKGFMKGLSGMEQFFTNLNDLYPYFIKQTMHAFFAAAYSDLHNPAEYARAIQSLDENENLLHFFYSSICSLEGGENSRDWSTGQFGEYLHTKLFEKIEPPN